MKKWVQHSLVGVVTLFGVACAAVLAAVEVADRKLDRQVNVAVATVPLRDDAISVERGAYLFRSRSCAECHGRDGAGKVVIDDGQGMLVRAPDITPAGVVHGYAPVDWVRTIRHGVKPDGRPAMIMPSEDYNRLTDDDLAALVASMRRLAPAQGRPAVVQLPVPVKVLYALGLVRDAAEKIDHRLPPSEPVDATVSAAHGAYVANSCIGCHGATLEGGRIPGAPPSWPAAARLAAGAGSAMQRYADVDSFAAMLRSGKRPDGTAVSPVMPFESLREMSELDVRSIHRFLTQPATR